MRFHLVLVALAAGCTGYGPFDKLFDSDDTAEGTVDNCPNGPYQGPVGLREVAVVCTGTTARFSAETEGLTGDGWVFSQETANVEPQWADNHTLESYEFDASCGSFDRLERTLRDGSTLADPLTDWQIDQSTIFTCEHHLEDNASMTFAFAVYDTSGNLAHCLAFGHDPEGMRNGNYDYAGEDPVFDLANCQEGEEAQWAPTGGR